MAADNQGNSPGNAFDRQLLFQVVSGKLPLMSLFPAARPFSLFACRLEIGRYHAGRGSRTRFFAELGIFLCLFRRYQDGLNRSLSVHIQNGYSFIPGHSQETSESFFEEGRGMAPSRLSMIQIAIAPFCAPLGFASTNPIGRLIAGALKPRGINKGFSQINGMAVDGFPAV